MEYVQLPLGMHFIYKDSATGIIDSVEVTQSDLSVTNTEAVPYWSPALHFQEYNLTLTKTNDSAIIWFSGSANSFYGTSFPRKTDSTVQIDFVGKDNIVIDGDSHYGFTTDSSSYYGVSYQYQPSLEVESKIYNDVFICTSIGITVSTQTENYKSTYYWVKKIGIVKRTIETKSGITTSLLESFRY
jgi:hypothetical protein